MNKQMVVKQLLQLFLDYPVRVLLHHHTSVVCGKLVKQTDSYHLLEILISDGKSFVFVHKNKRKCSQSVR